MGLWRVFRVFGGTSGLSSSWVSPTRVNGLIGGSDRSTLSSFDAFLPAL
jgi:hypothetical protein